MQGLKEMYLDHHRNLQDVVGDIQRYRILAENERVSEAVRRLEGHLGVYGTQLYPDVLDDPAKTGNRSAFMSLNLTFARMARCLNVIYRSLGKRDEGFEMELFSECRREWDLPGIWAMIQAENRRVFRLKRMLAEKVQELQELQNQ